MLKRRIVKPIPDTGELLHAEAVLAHAVAHLDPTNVQDGDLAEGERRRIRSHRFLGFAVA